MLWYSICWSRFTLGMSPKRGGAQRTRQRWRSSTCAVKAGVGDASGRSMRGESIKIYIYTSACIRTRGGYPRAWEARWGAQGGGRCYRKQRRPRQRACLAIGGQGWHEAWAAHRRQWQAGAGNRRPLNSVMGWVPRDRGGTEEIGPSEWTSHTPQLEGGGGEGMSVASGPGSLAIGAWGRRSYRRP